MGVWYSVFVRSFADSNHDGVGDLQGLISKLDYLSDLGVEGIWMLPIHPSFSYHKYDVKDYRGIDSEYGTLNDFDQLIFEAHKRNIKVMMDMVFNHVSDQHPWFQEAVRDKNNIYRNWFVWSKAELIPDKEKSQWYQPYNGPQDEYYYGLFWRGMPDLNYDNPVVREAIKDVAAFWLARGVDGFRFDAAMHIFPPGRERDNCLWWQEIRLYIDNYFPGKLLIGEITESCGYIAPYLKKGVNAAFNFELSEHILQAVLNGHHDCLADWLKGIHRYYHEVDADAKDAIFLTNHDQIRTASRLNNDQKKIKLAASILLTLPGIPFLYYGEEIGMTGFKPDEYLREPFLWEEKSKDVDRTRWIEPMYSTNFTVYPVATQKANPDSLWNHYKNLIQLRNENLTLDLGEINLVDCEEPTVLLYSRVYKDETLLILHNLLDEEAIIQNEDEPKVHFELVYKSDPDCESTPHEFKITGYATMILRMKN